MFSRLPQFGRSAAASFWAFAAPLLLLALLAGCSSASKLAGAPGTETAVATATRDQFGTGPHIVGVLAFPEPVNLSDGAADSVYRAAELAATSLNGNPVTVIVRTVEGPGGDTAGAIKELEAAGAGIVIGLNDENAAAQVAKAMGPKGMPTISLTSFSDLAIQLYGAGYVPNEEAVALVNEAARRGYTSLAIVSTGSRSSEDFAKAVLGLAAAAGISARAVDGSTDSQFVAGMTAIAAAGVPTSAIVFASGPARAGAMMSMLKADARFKAVSVIGNSGWALGGKLPAALKGAWYTSVASDGLARFADKFRKANNAAATLNAAMTYDLVVLAAALPQTIASDPYHPEVLTSAQGFKGFTGQFRFGPTGLLSARTYVIATVK